MTDSLVEAGRVRDPHRPRDAYTSSAVVLDGSSSPAGLSYADFFVTPTP